MSNENFGYFAMLDRMQYINRWSLMRNSRFENIKEHSFDVAVIAHALSMIHNKNFADGIVLDPYKVQSYALFHDCTEIITGDLPTPIKYKNETIKNAYKEVEHDAAVRLAELLPDDLQEEYLKLMDPVFTSDEEILTGRIVKAADRISAYIKCIREESSGNNEFISAKETIKASIDMIELPEVNYFMEKFVPSFGYTLDMLSKKNG